MDTKQQKFITDKLAEIVTLAARIKANTIHATIRGAADDIQNVAVDLIDYIEEEAVR